MPNERLEGLITRFTGHEMWVDVGGTVMTAFLRGRFRQKDQGIRLVAGDRVELSPPSAAGAPAMIEARKPRSTWLSRYTGGRRAEERVIVANIDVLFVVVSIRSPALHLDFVDRVLVAAERGHNKVTICLNKVDLAESAAELEAFHSVYASIGYPIIHTSATTGEGIDAVKAQFQGRICALVGQSGVGKSSLLNCVDNELKLKVRDVARKGGRGRHTTTHSQLYPVEGGYVADTPGMQTFGFPGENPLELPGCFPEFRQHEVQCQFQPCTHLHEPGCAVLRALEADEISSSRYKSYHRMHVEVEERRKQKF